MNQKLPATTPSGIEQLDGLTSRERELLSLWLWFYEDLHFGAREPSTRAQARFLAVCNGEKEPRTEHEAAYVRYRKLIDKNAPEAVVKLHWSYRLASETKRRLSRGKERLCRSRRCISDALIWPIAILSDAEFTRWLERWSADSFNTLSNTYTQAMDGKFTSGIVAGDPTTYPLIHRLFEGHTPLEAWQAVGGALPNDSFHQEVIGSAQALFSDMSSVVGLPVLTFSQESFERLSSMVGSLGVNPNYLTDFLHYSSVELLGSSIAALAVLLCWDEADTERFSALVGTLGVGAVVSANPLMGLIALVSMAKAFSEAKRKGRTQRMLSGLGKGSLMSGAVYATSCVIGGPAWVGLIASLCVMKFAKDHGRIEVGRTVSDMKRFLKEMPAKMKASRFGFKTAEAAS